MTPNAVTTNRNELFTRVEIQQILQNLSKGTTNNKLLDYNVVAECGPTGYLGEYFHLHLKYDMHSLEGNVETVERRLFVKSIPYQNPKMCDFIETSGILIKEAALYSTLLNELRQLTQTFFCAQCFYTRKDLFVMENIVDLGYESLPEPSNFLKAAQMGVLLKTLAIMHASSIAYEVKNNVNIGEKLKDVLGEMTVAPHVTWYTAGIKAILAVARVHPSYHASVHQSFITDELPARLDTVYNMVNPSTKYRNVFCHRDVWGGNLFFHKQHPVEVPVVLVDYQLSRYSPPAIDVLMAIYLNTTPEQRKTSKQCYYRDYYSHFAAALSGEMGIEPATQLTSREFEESLSELELFGALYNCISATILRVPGDYLKSMKLHQPTEFHRYTNVDRTKEVLELVSTDREFQQYMFECVDELLQLVLPSKK